MVWVENIPTNDLKSNMHLANYSLEETIEFTILQLFEVYYNIAQLTESNAILQDNLAVSQERQKAS